MWTRRAGPRALSGFQKLAEITAFRRLARLLLNSRHRGSFLKGVTVMARFENFAFAVGLVLTGILSLAAVPLA